MLSWLIAIMTNDRRLLHAPKSRKCMRRFGRCLFIIYSKYLRSTISGVMLNKTLSKEPLVDELID